jgi:hypothetical protein
MKTVRPIMIEESRKCATASCRNCKHFGKRKEDQSGGDTYSSYRRCLLPKLPTTKRGRGKKAVELANPAGRVTLPCPGFHFVLFVGPDYFCIHWERRP